ncbi:hypothetical protein KK425_07685 [Clostridioides difficile]|nr:hypothetical protein [Clostridioides difficile]
MMKRNTNRNKNQVDNILKIQTKNIELKKCSSGKELLQSELRDIDTLLLDIKMAELNSIDIARNIRKVDNNIYNISNKLCTGKI